MLEDEEAEAVAEATTVLLAGAGVLSDEAAAVALSAMPREVLLKTFAQYARSLCSQVILKPMPDCVGFILTCTASASPSRDAPKPSPLRAVHRIASMQEK